MAPMHPVLRGAEAVMLLLLEDIAAAGAPVTSDVEVRGGYNVRTDRYRWSFDNYEFRRDYEVSPPVMMGLTASQRGTLVDDFRTLWRSLAAAEYMRTATVRREPVAIEPERMNMNLNSLWFDGDIFEEAWRRAREERDRRRGATKLLKEWLSPEQWAQREQEGFFTVTGSEGTRYRIVAGTIGNVIELDAAGNKIRAWCFGPRGPASQFTGDVNLCQMIALQTDEAGAIAIANRVPY
jgi:hypothetical protein